MKKVWIKHRIIAATFIIALIFFSTYLNQGTTDMTVDMKEASLPIAEVLLDGQKVNEMHGYVNKMDISTIRDSITPIRENRALSFVVQKYGQEISEVSFEVRSADGSRLIEDNKILNYNEDRDTIDATVHLKDLIDVNTEYNFVLILKMAEGHEAYYYTRIIQNDDLSANEKIDFAKDFHNRTFDKEQAKTLSRYLEPNSEGDNSTFGLVSIHSSLDQVSWGNMNVRQIEDPSITICEIGKQTASISMDYNVNVKEGKISNYYRVREFYRIRYTANRFYLLSYNRTMDEIFTMEKESFANNKIILGIQNKGTQMMESDGGNILAFTNGGRVYSYNVGEKKLARLFAFYDEDHFDKRTYYNQSNVKILNVEENGNVSFMVYGYMNRGTHEGEVGIEICYFSSVLNTIEEQIFISSDKSPKILSTDVQELSYVNKSGKLFVFMDGTVYRVDTTDQSYEMVASGLSEETFHVSNTNKMIVWQEENKVYASKKLILMDLNTEEKSTIDVNDDEYIMPIGFMNEDLIYGIADVSDLARSQIGSMIFPMNRILIQSETGSVLKNYQMENVYITDGFIEDNQLTLKRVSKNPDSQSYESIVDDQISSNVKKSEGTNHITKAVTGIYETIVQIELKNEIDIKSIKFLTPKEVLYEGGRKVELENQGDYQRFFVYAQGNIMKIFVDPASAVKYAYDNMGTVIDNLGNEIYKRGELSTRNQIMAINEEMITDEKNSLAVCLDTILKYQGISRNTEYPLGQGQSAYDILSQNMKNVDILNLSGCNMDVILYYVNRDIPVLACMNGQSAVLVIGFNEQNTVLMDPQTGAIYKKGMNDSRTMFEENGNQFITYSFRNSIDIK